MANRNTSPQKKIAIGIACIFSLYLWNYALSLSRSDGNVSRVETSKTVLIFTVWSNLKNLEKFRTRILHHKQYADRHGYEYTFYVTGNNTCYDKDFKITCGQILKQKFSPGWLKVFAFKHFFDAYPYIDYFFYIDMDVLFYNFALPITEVLKWHKQSIFLATSVPDLSIERRSVLTPSHSLILKNNNISRHFVDLWLTSWNRYPSINMEQGALYATTAMWYDKTGNKSALGFSCPSYEGTTRANHFFGECCANYMFANHNSDQNGLFPNPDIFIFKFFSRKHIPPRDGFSGFPSSIDMNNSCPLVIHPYKNFGNVEVTPSYDNCTHL